MIQRLVSLSFLGMLGLALLPVAWFVITTWAAAARSRGGAWTLEFILIVGGPLSALLITVYPITPGIVQAANRGLVLLCIAAASICVIQALRGGVRAGVAPVVAVVVAFYSALVFSALGGASPGDGIPEVYWSTPLVLLAFLLRRDVTWSWFVRALRTTLRVTVVASLAVAVVLPALGLNVSEPRTLFGINRIQGITGHPNTLAILALVGLLLEVVSARWLWAAVMVAGLLFSQSHTVWISAGVALACLHNSFARALRIVLLGVVVLGLGIALFDPGFYLPIIADLGGESGFTLNGRTRIWTAALHGFTQFPVLGYGPTLLDQAFRAKYLPDFAAAAQSHNQVVQSLSGTGLVGLATLVGLMVFVVVAGSRRLAATGGLSLAIPVAFLLRTITETPLDPFGPSLGTILIVAVLTPIALTAPSSSGSVERAERLLDPAATAGSGTRLPTTCAPDLESIWNTAGRRSPNQPKERRNPVRIQDLVRSARRNIAILLAAMIIGSAVGLLHATLDEPQYESESQAVVAIGSATSVQDLSQGSSFTVDAVATYAQIATTPYVLSRVIKDLNLRQSAASLASSVSVSAPTETSILSITATDANPTRAADIANAVTRELGSAVTRLTPSRNTVSTVTITQLTPALPPTTPTGPGPVLEALLGLLGGTLVGIGIAALRTALDTRVRSFADLNALSDIPVIGTLVYSSAIRRTPLLMARSPFGPLAESFRSLRTNLQFVNFDDGARSIVLTSSVAGEGKSTTAANLAIAIADTGRSVVLVDADLRRPSVGSLFGRVDAAGLTDVLVGERQLAEAVERWGESGLHILPAGTIPPNPSELLQSRTMAKMMTQLRNDYDVVLIDSPPLLAASDAAILGHAADGVLLVAGSSVVHRGQILTSLGSLETVGVRVLGLVLSLAPLKGPDSYAYRSAYETDSASSGIASSSARPAVRHRLAEFGRGPSEQRDSSSPA